jgi:lipoprotein-releasing system ATP-binding protein
MRFEVLDVTRVFPGPPPLSVLRGVTLVASSGESVAVTGPSGSGKSTLLNIMGCLDRPSSGEVLLDGESLVASGARERAEFRARKIGFVFQMHHLLPQLTLLENVLLPLAAMRQPSRTEARRREERARALVGEVGLALRADARPGELSGGECQRAAVVRSLVNEPAVVLADEPTGSLDRETAASVGDLLFALCREAGAILVVVTHSAELASRAGRIANLAGGFLT